MKCEKCDGSGLMHGKYLGEFHVCDVCNGTGQAKNVTNEKRFCELPTVEKAKVFGNMLFEAWKDGLAEEMHDKKFYENLVECWLKEVCKHE